mmetsp:Transcript_13860/g.23422  ORF Transcript_13860/g.23422 Transcript_13860/m.23422 type:complete len:158 (-) Transcript_13860:86-559(-)
MGLGSSKTKKKGYQGTLPMGFGPRLTVFAFKFHVHGEFQDGKDCFGLHAAKLANKDGIVGWCKKISPGLITGEAESQNVPKLIEFKQWLRTVGPPGCTIYNAEFYDDREIPMKTHKRFAVHQPEKPLASQKPIIPRKPRISREPIASRKPRVSQEPA